MAKSVNPTKVITGICTFSYLNCWEPKAAQDGGKPKYSVSLIIPKTDTTTVEHITDRRDEEIVIVGEWIRENIRPAAEILEGRTSYGMKHILQHDTKIYLTNNEFKDAMWLAGYKPVDPDELNWKYRIQLTREINYNPSPFFEWARKFKNEDTPRGDFVGDMLREFGFPVLADHDLISRYLIRHHACDGAMDAFEDLWKEYTEQEKHKGPEGWGSK